MTQGMSSHREIEEYDPRSDAALKWPGWSLELADLHGVPEIICPLQQVVLVDEREWPEGADYAFSHALCHLDLGHHLSDQGTFTAEHEREADWLAQVRLDREPMGER